MLRFLWNRYVFLGYLLNSVVVHFLASGDRALLPHRALPPERLNGRSLGCCCMQFAVMKLFEKLGTCCHSHRDAWGHGLDQLLLFGPSFGCLPRQQIDPAILVLVVEVVLADEARTAAGGALFRNVPLVELNSLVGLI